MDVYIEYKDVKTDDINDDRSDKSKSKWNTSWCEQFMILYLRAFKHRRGHLISWTRFMDLVMICLLGGLVWFQIPKIEPTINDFMAGTFFIQIYLMFATMYFGVVHFPTEKEVIKKERQSGAYRLSAYYLSKIVAEIPVDIAIPMIAVTIFFWLAGFAKYFGAYLLYLLATVYSICVSNTFGILIGTSVSTFDKALSCLTISGMFFMAISGFWIKDNALPVFIRPFKYINFMRHGHLLTFAVLLDHNEWSCGEKNTLFERCNMDNPNYDGFIHGDDIKQFYGITEPVGLSAVILFGLLWIYLSMYVYQHILLHLIPKLHNNNTI